MTVMAKRENTSQQGHPGEKFSDSLLKYKARQYRHRPSMDESWVAVKIHRLEC